MNIIRPTTITSAMLQSSNIPETDYAEWSVVTAYTAGDYCIVQAQHKIYRALVNVTGGDSPEIDIEAATPKWQKIGATNRWKIFDQKIQAQSSQSESINWVLNPGLIDSIAVLNVDATDIRIIMADQATNLVTNGDAWTGASGTTQPTGWDKVGTPSDFTIDADGSLKMTADAAGEGISQTVAVVPGTDMQLLGKYRNTSGDTAQYAIYDVTHGADIVATTDLPASTVDSTISSVITVPAGCTSIKTSILAKSAGDIVWFDKISLSDVVYDETNTMLSTIAVTDWYTYFFEPIVRPTNIVRTNLAVIGAPPISTAFITIIVNNTGGTAKVGEIVVGLKFPIGVMQYQHSFSTHDYSRKTEDAFGNMEIDEGDYKTRLECDLKIKNTIRAEVHRQVIMYRATPAVWVGSEADRDSDLILYGYYESFETIVRGHLYSTMSLVAVSLT
jgi:hypothetical protein